MPRSIGCAAETPPPKMRSLPMPGGAAAGAGGDPNHTARRVDALHDLVFLTRGLSEEEVTVAVLHHLDGYTQDGIAESLDLSRRTVGKMLAKFEDHLKKRAARTGFTKAAHG